MLFFFVFYQKLFIKHLIKSFIVIIQFFNRSKNNIFRIMKDRYHFFKYSRADEKNHHTPIDCTNPLVPLMHFIIIVFVVEVHQPIKFLSKQINTHIHLVSLELFIHNDVEPILIICYCVNN